MLFSKDLSQAEKNDIVDRFITDQLIQYSSRIKSFNAYPDCLKVQGDKGQ